VGSRSFFTENKTVITRKFQFIRPHDILLGSAKLHFTANKKFIFRFTRNNNGKIVGHGFLANHISAGRKQPFSIPHTQAKTRNELRKHPMPP